MSYTASDSGRPCWYELGTGDLPAAADFYGTALGWSVADSGMPGFDYRIASVDGNGVAGMMSNAEQQGNPPANWIFYTEVADADATASAITEHGGTVLAPPADIPGTGRFAIAADPQGAVFGILAPAPMEGDAPTVSAFDQERTGHGNWHELVTSDPAAALDFYSAVFGWAKGETMPMGDDGDYQLYRAGETDLGGIMGLLGAPRPAWTVYFGADGVDAGIERITGAGATKTSGPNEVPGGAYVATFTDPQGAQFAIVGPR